MLLPLSYPGSLPKPCCNLPPDGQDTPSPTFLYGARPYRIGIRPSSGMQPTSSIQWLRQTVHYLKSLYGVGCSSMGWSSGKVFHQHSVSCFTSSSGSTHIRDRHAQYMRKRSALDLPEVQQMPRIVFVWAHLLIAYLSELLRAVCGHSRNGALLSLACCNADV